MAEGLQERIDLLKKVHESEEGNQHVLPMIKDSSDSLSSHNIFIIQNKSLFLIRAYQIALERMQVGVKWVKEIFREAVHDLNNLGVKTS